MEYRSISVIIPVYNEEKTVAKLVETVLNADIGGLDKDIVVVDDASKDRSLTMLESIAQKHKNVKVFHHETNRGKGAAIRTGIAKCTGDIVVVQDADLEYDPNELGTLVRPILEGKSKVVFGSRLMGHVTGFNVPLHYWGNKILSLATSIIYFRKINDMETCYKMMTRDVILSLPLKAERFDLEPEITAKLLKRGFNILELPIRYNCRTFEEGKKITWKDGLKALFYLVKYRFVD